jgi:pimeloyl-ACP methyl ester carboxylesterase
MILHGKMKKILYMVLIIILSGCATPKRSVRIEDRLWLENDYYNRLKNITVNYRIDRVLTRFGHTQVLVSGENNLETIILLHPMGLNLTSWTPQINTLSEHYRIIAIDTIGDQGRSIVRRDYPETIKEYSFWLNDIIEFYGIIDVNIIGNSMGGWIAHGYAIHFYEKIEKLILISPAAGIPAKTNWGGLILKMIFTNNEKKLQEVARGILGNNQAHNDWLEYMGKASKDYKSAKVGIPKNFTEKEIRSTGGRILLLIGENETIYKSIENVFKKVQSIKPDIVCKLIPNAGHLGGWDNPQFVNNEIKNFIGGFESKPLHPL